ncbi:MAG: hypothetical protein ACE5JL_09395 [Dehalococcoidia bacterium]
MVRHFPGRFAYVFVGGLVGLILAALSAGPTSWLLEASDSSDTLTVTGAELDRGRLKVEGEDADPNTTIFVDGVAMGGAGAQGRFRVERSGFNPPSCSVDVSDGVSSVGVFLSGCGLEAPLPPTGFSALSVTTVQLDGEQLKIEGTGARANGTIFVEGVAMGIADDQGRFRVERSGFNPSSCDVTVSDGVGSADVSFNPCTVPPRFTALEVELLEEPLGVPATPHANPGIDSTQVPADLPLGSIVSFEIEGVVKDIDPQGLEWQIGSLPLFVYTSFDTRVDDAPQSGDLVRIGAVRGLEPGPLVAERIRRRQPGPLPVGPGEVELAFLFSGVLQSEGNDVLRVGGVRFATTDATEIDPAVGDGNAVVIAFVPVENVP